MSVLSDGNTTPTKFNAGDAAFIQCQETFDIIDVMVTMVPTLKTKKYTVKLQNNTTQNVDPDHIFDVNNAPAPDTLSMSLAFFRPKWMKQDQKVTILKDNTYTKGYLNINKDGYWEFVTYGNDGKIISHSSLSDLQYTWKMRMQENRFDIRWNFEMAHCVYGIGRHVSATDLNTNFAPANLRIALAGSNPDNKIWNSAYDEEYEGLQGLEVFTEIKTSGYLEYVRKHGDAAQAIPTMNLFTIKPDMKGNPTQAKSRIVALGNLEKQIWSQEDRYAPVLSATAARLLTSMAVEDGR